MTIPYLRALWESARPNTWLRVWGEMIVAAAFASGSKFQLYPFLLTFLAASPLLWTAAYMLNDLTDTALDRQHPYRSRRPITLGHITKKHSLITIGLLSLMAYVIGAYVHTTVLWLLILLSISQVSYTVRPFRFKERPFVDIGVNALNSALRFLLGWASQLPLHPFPYWILFIFVCLKVALFLGHKIQNINLERANHIRSTVTIIPKRFIQNGIVALVSAAGVFYIISLLTRLMPLVSLISVIGIVPLALYYMNHRHTDPYSQEKNLGFRNALYLSYFLWANSIALTRIFI